MKKKAINIYNQSEKTMKKIYALTLIETLIAILVFWIGILVVLQWLSQTIRNQEYANMQIKSAFLAREWIELMFNLRDANYRKELEWNCIFNHVEQLNNEYEEDENPFCSGYFKPWTRLKLWIWSDNNYIEIESNEWNNDSNTTEFDNLFEEYRIYKHISTNSKWEKTFVYNHTEWENSNEENDDWTRFARYIEIKAVKDDNNKDISEDKLLKIESHVLYKKWAMTGEKVMETFIGNYEF